MTTAADLYFTSDEFRAFLAHWVKDRRPPLAFVDWLLDRGMDAQADCVRWAATVPDRRWCKWGSVLEAEIQCGAFPVDSDGIHYFIEYKAEHKEWADCVPTGNTPGPRTGAGFWVARGFTPELAIVDLMDLWIPLPEGVTP